MVVEHLGYTGSDIYMYGYGFSYNYSYGLSINKLRKVIKISVFFLTVALDNDIAMYMAMAVARASSLLKIG